MAGVTRSGAERMAAIRSALARSYYFALPLSKREGVDQMSADRISIGRALNKDIVLRDESVSKFHAWFELHEGRDFSLADAGSTNQTCVNGEALVARQLQPLSDGDSLSFGAINGLICSAESLWSAIHDD